MNDPSSIRWARRHLLSFRDFVEQALFNPRWGYYATGAVQFGDGGHYDTYPIALSPFFGRMVAQLAFRRWRAWGRPARFEVCEVGAGNGQLCLDTIVTVELKAESDPHWQTFRRAFRYRILEKSAALQQRQAQQLGPLASRVVWDHIDLASSAPRRRGRHGLVVANEVLDCLAHHKVVRDAAGRYRVGYVGAHFAQAPRSRAKASWLTRSQLDQALARSPADLHYTESLLPIESDPALHAFMQRHYPLAAPIRGSRHPWIYFACPAIETFVANAGRLYGRAEILLFDYGGEKPYHRRAPAHRRLRAGRPEEGASPYRAPGRDDITFMVDFSVAREAAKAAGLEVAYFGGQGELARRSGVTLNRRAVDVMVRQRSLSWLLAVSGVGPEHEQRRGALSWTKPPRRRRPRTLLEETLEGVDAFLGRRRSPFKLLVLRKSSRRCVSRRREAVR